MRSWFPWTIVVLLSVLVSCGHDRTSSGLHRPPVIGFSLDSLVLERWKKDIQYFQDAAQDLGAKVIVKTADQDARIQEAQVRQLVDQGIDVLVIVANDADLLTPVVREVRSRGIPVLSYDRLVRNAGVDLYISFDNEEVGSLMTKAVLQSGVRGGFLIINGAKNDNNALMIHTGIVKVLQPYLVSGSVHLVSEIWPETWDNSEVRTALDQLQTRGGEISGVVAGDDMLAEEAIRFFSENGMSKEVRVAGQDADLAACQRIAEGTQFATVYKPIKELALRAAGLAVMLGNHEPVPSEGTLYDGSANVPYIRLKPILVTRSNLDSTVIKDRFHTTKEVYQNVGP